MSEEKAMSSFSSHSGTMKTVTSIQRKEWTIGSKVRIYSESQSKWIEAEIVRIFHDNEGEWLEVKYAGFVSKQIQRYNQYIIPTQNKAEIADANSQPSQPPNAIEPPSIHEGHLEYSSPTSQTFQEQYVVLSSDSTLTIYA